MIRNFYRQMNKQAHRGKNVPVWWTHYGTIENLYSPDNGSIKQGRRQLN